MKTHFLHKFLLLICSGILVACSISDDLIPAQSNSFVKIYGGNGMQRGNGISLAQDGGFMLLGSTTSFGNGGSDVFLVKTDANGNQVWQKTYGGDEEDTGIAIQPHENGFVILSHETVSTGKTNIILRKVDGNGEVGMTLSIGADQFNDQATDLIDLEGQGYLIVGSTERVDSSKFPNAPFDTDATDMFIAKVDGNLTLQWERTYGNLGVDQGASGLALDNEEYLILGTTDFSAKDGLAINNFRLIHLDREGRLIDARLYGDLEQNIAYNMLKTSDNHILLAGENEGKAFLAQLDENLNIGLDFPKKLETLGPIRAMIETANQQVLMAGSSADPDNALIYLTTSNTAGEIGQDNIQYFGDQGVSTAKRILDIGNNKVAIFGTLHFGSNTMMILIKSDIIDGLTP